MKVEKVVVAYTFMLVVCYTIFYFGFKLFNTLLVGHYECLLSITYYSGSKILPVTLFTFYFFSRIWNPAPMLLLKIASVSTWVFVYVVAGVFGFVLSGLIVQFPFYLLTRLDWSYAAMTEWLAAFLYIYTVYFWRTKKPSTSFVSSLLSVSAAGFIYELPLYTHMDSTWLINNNHPFLIATPVLAITMLPIILHDLKWKPNKTFCLCLTGFLVFSIIYYLTAGTYTFTWTVNKWIPRLPAIILFLSIPYTLKEEN